MTDSGQIKIQLLVLSLALVVLAGGQETTEQNNKRNISLEDPSVDETVKSALENGSVSEVVVRKDLLLFPLNAPNLVIAHTQEIHAVPHTNGSNTTDGKPTAAEIAEVNEYSLSQLVSTNDTDYDNETKSASSAVTGRTLLRGPQNVSVLEPSKLLQIVSGFNLSHGLATETLPLPDQVQNINIPKQSIAGLLSKSIQQSDTLTSSTLPAYDLDASHQEDATATDFKFKRSAQSEESNSSRDAITAIPPYPYIVRKRSIDSDEYHTDDSSTSDDDSSEEAADPIDEHESLTENSSFSTFEYEPASTSSTIPENTKISKRSIDLDANSAQNSSSNSQVGNSLEKFNSTDNQSSLTNNRAFDRIHNTKEKFRDDSPEDMDVAEDIVFRPLFRYRQETRLRQQAAASRKYGYRQSSYNPYDTNYDD